MKLNINITTDEYCNILITDNSVYQNVIETTITPDKLKFSDTVSIVTIIHSDTREDELKYYHVDKHISKSFKIPMTFDGVFTVNFTVIPTMEWYNRVLERGVSKEALIQAFGGNLRVYNGEYVVEIQPNNEEHVPISEFIDSPYQDNLSISKYSKQLLSVCKLRKCYINLCQQIFDNKNFSPCWNKNRVNSEIIYKRDLLWMIINVITYLWKLGNNEEEIEKLLKQVNACNGICQPYPDINKKENGCGCSSK